MITTEWDLPKILQFSFIGAFFVLDLTVAAPNFYAVIFYNGFDLFTAGPLFLFLIIYYGWFHVLRHQEFIGYWNGHYLVRGPLRREERSAAFWLVFAIIGLCHFALHLRVLDVAHVFSFYSF